MKFGQFLKCKMRNCFLQKSCGKWGRKTDCRRLFILWKIWQPRYSTVSCCLMEWSTKDILISFKPFVFEKIMYLVLISPKWIDSLLSMNHWHNYENSLFKTLSISLNPHVGRRDRCHLHTNRSLRPIMIGEDHLYITEVGAVQE